MTDFIIKMFPYLIGLVGVAASFYTVQRTIKHQRLIKSVEIKNIIRTKQLNDFIDAYTNLIKIYNDFQYYVPNYIIETRDDFNNANKDTIGKIGEMKSSLVKMWMLLEEESALNLDIIKLTQEINHDLGDLYINKISKNNDDDTEIKLLNDKLENKCSENKTKLSEKCVKYVHNERKMISNMIPDKNDNKFIKWFKKSWREMGEYK